MLKKSTVQITAKTSPRVKGTLKILNSLIKKVKVVSLFKILLLATIQYLQIKQKSLMALTMSFGPNLAWQSNAPLNGTSFYDYTSAC